MFMHYTLTNVSVLELFSLKIFKNVRCSLNLYLKPTNLLVKTAKREMN